ncbi:MAG: hypothetical protein KF760_33740 [Candidatus Eremiobacteraeota bacterium]|nr:hypothetical protein [Candidatus Eremiobacteraeota bacterium]MCW5869865.1 hypothetical protein [Candidatus Eremiobacteraeota bacterium]
MNSKLIYAGLVSALLIAGCGNDDNDFNPGDRNNYPIINPNNPGPGQPQNPNPFAPAVTLDSGTLSSIRGAAGVPFAPGATVTDLDTSTLQNGTLTITGGSGLILTSPGTPDIGTVTGSGTNTLSVALNNNATLAAVQQFLRAVTLASAGTAAFGPNTVSVSLSDGTGQTSQTVTRNVSVVGVAALNLTVGQGGLTTIQQAVDQVAATDNGQGSTITIPAGTFNETVNISNDPDLAGLTLLGPNSSISAGVTPSTRGAEATFNRLNVDAPNVTLSGVTISEGVDAGIDEAAGILLRAGATNFTASNDRFIRTGAAGNFRGLINTIGTTNGNVTLRNNLFQGFATGVYLQGTSAANPATGSILSGNAFSGNNVGLSLDNVQNTQITGNGFRNQSIEQIGLLNPGNTVVASGNSFDTSSSLTVYTGTAADTGSLDARNNFFGTASGPADAGNNPRVNTSGTGTFNIQTTPFLTTNPFPSF